MSREREPNAGGAGAAERAPVSSWGVAVDPLLAERLARQRLTALAKVEGRRDDHRPVVLFLCVHNAGHSQVAMVFFQHLAGDRAIAWSGGSEPGIEINRAAVEAMAERGINIATEHPETVDG